MKKINIKYNPYTINTEITVDGQTPKPNSALRVGKKRLQEWVETLPQIILDEYRDSNVTVEFTGSKNDYDDIVSSFEAYKDQISASCNFHQTKDISDVEKEIDQIFVDIQNGPIPELKDPRIIAAFQKAKNSEFEIDVVATMSSGKSTLINALLGKQLMPAANEATTATIVRIVDTDQDNYSATAYDKSNQIVKKLDNVTLEDMKQLNSDEKVSMVELKGRIPFVSTVGMKLVLVDTPGPNNSRDKRHREMTYSMIADSDKSLVLYVMNATQLNIDDDKIFLDYVCQCMKDGGKQSRERFIFAVNRMDAFKPKEEGQDCIERALNTVKTGLEERGILNPNIFPGSSLVALQLRTDDDEPLELNTFKFRTQKYEVLHFEKYYTYSNLPLTVQKRINRMVEKADENGLVEIHTGIVSIEQAIAQFINKYARTTKVRDLVLAFNEKLNELEAVAHLEKAIREDKKVKAALDAQIQGIKEKISSAENAKKRSTLIDNIDLEPVIKQEIKSYIFSVNKRINSMLSGNSNKVEKSIAEQQCIRLGKDCESISMQIKVQINKILEKSYTQTLNRIVAEYTKYLKELNINLNTSALSLNPANLVAGKLADLSAILQDNTETVDESYYVKDSRMVKKEGGVLRKIAHIFTFGVVDNYTMVKEEYNRKIAKYTDYVDMNEVASEYLVPFQKNLNMIENSAISHVKSETRRLKDYLRESLREIDRALSEKLDALSKTESDSQAKSKDIAQKEMNLQFLMKIQERVNNIINF